MSSLSNYLEGKLADLTLRGTSYTPPGEVFIALFTTDPTDANTGTEVSYPAYARVSTGATPASAWTALDSNGTTQNANTVTFPAVNSASAVTVTHWGIYDAVSGGNLLFHGPLATPKTLDPSDVPSFPPASLKLTWN